MSIFTLFEIETKSEIFGSPNQLLIYELLASNTNHFVVGAEQLLVTTK